MSRLRTRAFAPLAIIILAACQSTTLEPGSSQPSTEASAGASAATASAEPTSVAYGGSEALIPMAAGPRGVAWADGSIWVASTLGDVVQRVDPTTNRVVAEISAGARPVTLVTVDQALWASVLNADPATDDEVVRIDPASNTVDLRVTVPVHHNIAAGADAIWVLDQSGNLRRVNAITGEVTDATASGLGPVALAANGSAVFGIRGNGTVWRYAIGGGALTEVQLAVRVPGRSRIVASDEGLWVAVPGRVLALDIGSLEVLAELALPQMSLVNDLFVTDVDVWLSANVASDELGLEGGSVLRLDPATLEIRETLRLGPESSGVVVAEGSVWAVDQADDRLARFRLR